MPRFWSGYASWVSYAGSMAATSIDAMARRWWLRHPLDRRQPRGLAIVAGGVDSLANHLVIANKIASDPAARTHRSEGTSIHKTHPGKPPGTAFVYPGLGNYFAGMGRELAVLWPEALRRQETENRSLRDQLAPDLWWSGRPLPPFADHRAPILGQVAVGSLVTDVLLDLGIVPDAAIGYSMGESAALVALRAWTGRDELMARLNASPLFATELAGPCDAARRAWGISPDRQC